MGKIYESFYLLLEQLKFMNAKYIDSKTYYIEDYIKFLEIYKDFVKILPSYVSFIILDIKRNIEEVTKYLDLKQNNIFKVLIEENNNHKLKYKPEEIEVPSENVNFVSLYNKNIGNNSSIIDQKKMMLHVPLIWSWRKFKFTHSYLHNLFISNIDCKKCAALAYDESLNNSHNPHLSKFIHSFFIFAPNKLVVLNKISKLIYEQENILEDMDNLLEELNIFLENIYNFIIKNKILLNKYCRV